MKIFIYKIITFISFLILKILYFFNKNIPTKTKEWVKNKRINTFTTAAITLLYMFCFITSIKYNNLIKEKNND